MRNLHADRGELSRFIHALFRYADDGTFVSLRAFDQVDRTKPAALIRPVRIGRDLERLTEEAARAAESSANRSQPIVFAPPICTFNNADRARVADLSNGLTLSVEIDDGDTAEARNKLETILGPATIVVESGGEWVDPVTGEIHPKIHLHWRLNEPTREEVDHTKLRQARDLAARLVGADPTGKPVVHPLRWPGSWNMKRAPKLARIVAFNDSAEIDLDTALDAVNEAIEASGLKSVGMPVSGKPEAPVQALASAMQAIPNAGLEVHYDKWIRLGYACYRGSGGSGFHIWDEWSRKSEKYNSTETVSAWKRIQHAIEGSSAPRTVGAGTIFFEALAAGWKWPSLDRARTSEDAAGLHTDEPKVSGPSVSFEGAELPLLWFDQIEPVLDAADFVQGVLVQGGSAVVYGESNAGKTFFTTDLSLHVASGLEWQGKRVEQGGVIYCVLEGGIGFRNRVAAWREAHGLRSARIPFAAIPCGMNLLNPEADTPRLIQAIQSAQDQMDVPVKLVVIDTLARAFAGGNENSSEDMGALVLNMDAIRAATGAMVLFVHHSGKDQARGARGHSSLRAAIDTEIEVVADANSDYKTATIVKQREMAKGDTFAFTLDVVKIGVNRHGEDVTTCIVMPADRDKAGQSGTDRGRHLTPTQQAGLDMLCRAMSKHGGVAPPTPDYPPDVVVVPVEAWRREFYAGAKAGESPDTKRRLFNRARDELAKKKIISSYNDLFWLVSSTMENEAISK